jgi:hypothetical protein
MFIGPLLFIFIQFACIESFQRYYIHSSQICLYRAVTPILKSVEPSSEYSYLYNISWTDGEVEWIVDDENVTETVPKKDDAVTKKDSPN